MDDASRTPTDLTLMDACALADAIHARKVSCVEVMTAFLDRIERAQPDGQRHRLAAGPRRPAARRPTRATTSWRAASAAAGCTASRTPSRTWPRPRASAPRRARRIFDDFVPAADAIFVERMRAAGAIIIGKTNAPEFGLGSQHLQHGVRPDAQRLRPGARPPAARAAARRVALALRMLPVADGSDHGGSLRNPAACNNVFGFRPSLRPRARRAPTTCSMPQMGVAGPDGAHRPRPRAAARRCRRATTPRAAVLDRRGPGVVRRAARSATSRAAASPGSATSAATCRWSPASSTSARARSKVFEDASAARSRRRVPDFDPKRCGRPGVTLRAWQPAARSKPSTTIPRSAR